MRLSPSSPLGATYTGSETFFHVRSRDAERVELCLIGSSGDREAVTERRIEMARADDASWFAYADVAPGQRYGYRVHGPFEPERGLRMNPAKLLLDPYGRAIDEPDRAAADFALLSDAGSDGAPDERDTLAIAPWSVVCATRSPVPSSRPGPPASGRVIYEAHLGQLTGALPDVEPAARGTFSALHSPTLIAHLKRIGVSTLELLPLMHAADEPALVERGQRNVWGYNPLGFFSPAPRYCRAQDIDGQWEEIASAVRRLHEEGIEVIFDVVYNHTAEGPQNGPTYHLRGLDNLAYYLSTPADPAHYLDVTGCGNAVNAAHPFARALIVDSLRHWVEMTDVDGFRFDLATTIGRSPSFSGDHPLLEEIGADPVIGDRLLIAEPWDLGADGYQLGAFTAETRGEPWAEWNDQFRTAIRDYWRPAAGSRAALTTAFAGSQHLWGDRPASSSIAFVTAHDGFTLRDLVSYDHKHNLPNGEHGNDGSNDNHSWNGGVEGETDDPQINRLRLNRQGSMLVSTLLQIGTPMITAGDEANRTQRGNNNPYCLDADYLQLSWRPDDDAEHLSRLTAEATRVRREHARLYDGRWLVSPGEDGGHLVHWLGRDGERLTEAGWADSDKLLQAYFPAPGQQAALLLIFNGEPTAATAAIPRPRGDAWTVELSTSSAGAPAAPVDGSITVDPFSLVVLTD